jgi:hypothetical protein
LIRSLVLLGALFAGIATAADAPVHGTRAGEARALTTPTSSSGCCTDPDVLDFGYHVDFSAWGDGEEMTDQLRSTGLLFGRAINPDLAPTMILTDPSRGTLCQSVLNGEPAFAGWEYFIFVDPVTNRWATVQKVGADIGFADREQICFLAAYDRNGNLLDFQYNDRVGFQFLSVQRPTADISRVLIGDCDGPYCYQDGGGSALNCLTFSGPVSTSFALPAQITVPRAPIIQGVPGVEGAGTLAMSLILLGGGIVILRRRTRRRPVSE